MWRKTASGIFVADSPEWGGKKYRDYVGLLGLGNGSQVSSSPVLSAGILNPLVPKMYIWFAPNDSNANGVTGANSNISPINSTLNYTQHQGNFGAQLAPPTNNDILQSQWGIPLTNASGWGGCYQCNTSVNYAAGGVRMGNVRTWDARIAAKTFILTGGAIPTLFVGIQRAITDASGLKSCVEATNTPPTGNWGTTIAHVGFIWQPSVSLNWQIQVGDGAGGVTLLDSGVLANTTISDLLQFTYDGSKLLFYINSVKVATIITTIPANSAGMCNVMAAANLSATAQVAQPLWGWGYVCLGYQ